MSMKILLAASELGPFTGDGEFSAAIRALSAELVNRGHDISVVLPWYRTTRENGAAKAKKTGAKFSVPVGSGRFPGVIRELRSADGVQVYFVERDEFFDRSGLYGSEEGDYQDNAARFLFFSKCVIELARRMDPAPDIVHAHNWQAAFVPVLAANLGLPFRTVLSAHTLAYQGNFWSYDFGLTNLPADDFSPRGLEYFGSMNLLKAGILRADSVVLPGPRYVSEAQTKAHGCGLDPVLREQARKLEGVANGMDTGAWDPATDKTLARPYASAAGKAANRKAWLAETGLDPGAFHLLTVTSSLTDDSLEILLPVLDHLFESGARLAILGKAAPSALAALEFARRKYARRLSWQPDCDERQLRLGLAGSDALLCPATIMPDATVLMRALRYGTLPVAMACGGLQAIAPAYRGGAGVAFPFFAATPEALLDGVRHAAAVHADSTLWAVAVDRALATDFSWAANAAATEAIYASLLGRGAFARAA